MTIVCDAAGRSNVYWSRSCDVGTRELGQCVQVDVAQGYACARRQRRAVESASIAHTAAEALEHDVTYFDSHMAGRTGVGLLGPGAVLAVDEQAGAYAMQREVAVGDAGDVARVVWICFEPRAVL